jgi:predicted CoA-binding protein
METDTYTDDEIREILSLKKITVVGMSKHERKAAHFVPKYLSKNNYEITPVNPTLLMFLDPLTKFFQ